ncbi:hypothetical protein EDB81DRAFT_879920 [Dactylonectria macrodidyma]|uniref:Uncharacterized protein n=1 Tax=Dactylonectria macrodidyma TaxID=307937 RepID=A0A9P9FGH9_9HYPO|nr:hypothetical protein EDB81DRAFT_879920 [Dactylonectria macrodidyma]
MAASSVDLPPQPDDEVAPPAMLGRARGLASAIGVAAVAVAGHHQVLGDVLARGGGREGVVERAERAAEEGKRGRNNEDEEEEAEDMEGVVSGPLTVPTPAQAAPPAAASTDVGNGGGLRRKGTTDVQGRSALSPSRPGHPDNSSPPYPYHHTRSHSLGPKVTPPNTAPTAIAHTQSGRITKTRHRPTASASITSLAAAVAAAIATSKATKATPTNSAGATALASSTSSANLSRTMTPRTPTPQATTAAAGETTSAAAASGTASTTGPSSSAASTASSLKDPAAGSSKPSTAHSNMTAAATAAALDKDAPVLSFWGPEPVPLPSRFARIKRNLIRGHEAELEASWVRLLTAIVAEVDHIEALGAHLIPSIEFADIDNPTQSTRFGRDLKRYGVGVIRKVVPKADADVAVQETVEYLKSKSHIKTQHHDPACFDFFWTPAQVRARAHPGVLSAQRFMMNLWETSPDDRLVTRFPITYVDRLRVHGAGDNRPHDLNVPPPEPPQSADDWISALESSAGIIAQVDNGSLERWEPDGYQHAGTYNHVFHGRWEDHDPWECASRVSATMDLYNGYGACTIFRMFQGVLALSTVEPGMVRLLPSPKLATAYYLLRPFFSTRNPPPESRSGPEWDAYLHPSNWKLEKEPDSIIHGAVPGHAQRITEHWHPHLHLRGSMITLPTLQPGDYIFWHPDLPYYLSSNNYGLKTPSGDNDNVSMLVYVPAAPLTQTNALYLARQRKAFQRGHPGPDFDSTGRGNVMEEDADTRPGEKEIAEIGGPAALQAMGLAPWEVAGTRAGTPPIDRVKPKEDDTEMETEAETKSLMSSSSSSHAEAEVVRLANIILFPDRSMLGYSV